MADLADMIVGLPGPIVVIGASGFVGANLFERLARARPDVYATHRGAAPWRLADARPDRLLRFDMTRDADHAALLALAPKVVFDCSSYGAYSFETDVARIYEMNVTARAQLMESLSGAGLHAYVSAGSSSEYGLNSDAPAEDSPLVPNSHYAVSKAAIANLVTYFGRVRDLPCVHLRLYSVYGPFEDPSRLIPVLARRIAEGRLPDFAARETVRDFVHVDDVTEAFVRAAARMAPDLHGEIFNIGTGRETSLGALADLVRARFGIAEEPRFGAYAPRRWDVAHWRADPSKAEARLGWTARVPLEEGLVSTVDWWRHAPDAARSAAQAPAPPAPSRPRSSVSAVIACYKDGPAVPIMYERLVATFRRIGVDYEIIFVDDASPDDAAERIREISARDPNVLGISHSRNFGSQNAFRSGMELATKEAVVLLDGDLQDPPELIEQFVAKWREGADVVYGSRVAREMPPHQHLFYKAFYRFFRSFSYIDVPVDAGDFSLIDRRVVHWLLKCGERDVFLRGLRSYVGFRQVGVPYVRPERMFGRSTNNLLRNLGWAKKGILSFSFVPLNALTFFSAAMFVLMSLVMAVVVAVRLLFPASAPEGVTTLILAILTFGVLNLLAISIVGEYVGKIVEEVKARPPYIRAAIIRNGETHAP